MCGFAGCATDIATESAAAKARLVERMAAGIAHRGPDSSGTWTAQGDPVSFGFQRLSIVDLSEAGHQPMTSASGRFVICFNGEVYNHVAMRQELASTGVVFRGRSDTEVVLAAIERYGVREAFRRAAGMFAAAVWDRTEFRLYLVRDRVGEKPLYYGWADRALVFGSELHALRRHPDFEGIIDPAAVASLMRFGYVPTPGTIYRGVWKLRPGSILSIDLRNGIPSELPAPEEYWLPTARSSFEENDSCERIESGSGKDWVDRLERLLTDVVSEQVVADVPLGAFLSGGVDSSVIVALMQKVSPIRVKTYTIGFNESRFNEAPYAKEIAGHLKTDHTEWYVTERMALDLVPKLGCVYDEPFADSSQIPTLLVCQLARRHVTVCLSGDGGDEVFGGYARYKVFEQAMRLRGLVPAVLRKAGAAALRTLGDSSLSIPRALRPKLSWAADLLGARNDVAAYARMMSSGRRPEDLLLDPVELPSIFNQPLSGGSMPFLRRLMSTDLQSYLLDDILVKVDRAAMSTSLETRAPYLDHRVVEFANSLPLNCLKRSGVTKWVLRELLDRHVPTALTNRPKMGFGVPLDAWMRGALRDWCEAHLSASELESSGLFRVNEIRRLWTRHVKGEINASTQLWPLLMFQQWKTAQHVESISRRAVA